MTKVALSERLKINYLSIPWYDYVYQNIGQVFIVVLSWYCPPILTWLWLNNGYVITGKYRPHHTLLKNFATRGNPTLCKIFYFFLGRTSGSITWL